MMKHLKRFVAITISMVMAFQFCTNDFYLYAATEPADPGQTQVTNEPESEPSDSTGEAAEETPPSDTGTPEPSAPVEEQPAAPVEEQPAPPVEEQREVASTLKVEFVDANNTSVKETVEQALTSKYVKDTINLDELGIDINVEGYTLTEVKDKNDNTQVYTTETKDFVLTGNVTELQFVYTQNVQTDQPEDSQEPSTPQGGQEDQNSEEDQEDTDDEDSDSQTNEGENEVKDNEYNIVIHHSLSTNVGIFEEYESIKIKDSDFVDGKYDLSQHEYYKVGMELSSAPVVEQDDVQSYYTIKYSVKKGYIARRIQNSDVGIFARTIYVGSFEDVEIVPIGEIPVSIKAVYDNDGTIAFSKTVTAFESEDKYELAYDISKDIPLGYSIDQSQLPDGYKLTEEGILTSTYDSGTESASVTIYLNAQDITYTVKHVYPALNENEEPETVTEEKLGKVGQMTDAQPTDVKGFTALEYDQVLLVADSEIEITINYERNTYTVTYDSQGGSYISPVKGLYEEEVEIYKQEDGEPILVCGMEEHTHDRDCYNWDWGWQLSCGMTEHEHDDSCYASNTIYDKTPTRPGYKFTGWYTDPECNNKADSSIQLLEDTTVYAGWEAQKVNYTVVMMKEMINQSNNASYYAYGGSETRTAFVGDEVTGS